jgi:hypothetical protein
MEPLPELGGQGRRAAAQKRTKARSRSAGVVMVEYAFLLVFFGLPVMLATAAAGITLIRVYGDIRNDMLHQYP